MDISVDVYIILECRAGPRKQYMEEAVQAEPSPHHDPICCRCRSYVGKGSPWSQHSKSCLFLPTHDLLLQWPPAPARLVELERRQTLLQGSAASC